MAKPFAIDIHAHTHVLEIDELVASEPGYLEQAAREPINFGQPSLETNRALWVNEWKTNLTQLDARYQAMDNAGIDMQAVSISPMQYHAWADKAMSTRIVRMIDEYIAELVASDPNRFVGLGSVGLQHPDLAVDHLKMAMEEYSLLGVEIPTRAGNLDFSAPELEEFWATAEALNATIFIHPWGCTLGDRLSKFYLGNTIGNPTETTVALSHIIFGGVLDRYPKLKICSAHGGGYLPFYIARSDHTWEVRPESKLCERTPSEYLKQMWFDSLVFQPGILAHLIDVVGYDRVVLGSDYAYDMGVWNSLERMLEVPNLSEDQQAAIAGKNAAKLLGISIP